MLKYIINRLLLIIPSLLIIIFCIFFILSGRPSQISLAKFISSLSAAGSMPRFSSTR